MAEKCTNSNAEDPPTSEDDPISDHHRHYYNNHFACLEDSTASATEAVVDCETSFESSLLFTTTTPPTTTTTSPTNIPNNRGCCDVAAAAAAAASSSRTTAVMHSQSTDIEPMIGHASTSSSGSAAVASNTNTSKPRHFDSSSCSSSSREPLHHVGGNDEVSAVLDGAIDRMKECASSAECDDDDDHEHHTAPKMLCPITSSSPPSMAAIDEKVVATAILSETPVAETQQQQQQQQSLFKQQHTSNHNRNKYQDNQTQAQQQQSHHQDVVVVLDAAANAKNIELLMVVETSMSSESNAITKTTTTTTKTLNPMKRLSDEYFSADDGSEEDNEDVFVPRRQHEPIADNDEENSQLESVELNNTVSIQSTNTPISVDNEPVPAPEETSQSFENLAKYETSSGNRNTQDESSSPTLVAGSSSLPKVVRHEIPTQHGDEQNEYFEHDEQSMDAQERRDLEEEYKITGERLIACRSTNKSLGSIRGIINNLSTKVDIVKVVNNEPAIKSPIESSPQQLPGASRLSTTPKSSRTKMLRFGLPSKSIASARLNLSESLEKAVKDGENDYNDESRTSSSNTAEQVATEAAEAVSSLVHSIINKLGSVANVDSIASSSSSTSVSTMSAAVRIRLSQQPQKYDASSFFSNNSNDSSDSSDNSYTRTKSAKRQKTTMHQDESPDGMDSGSDVAINECVQSPAPNNVETGFSEKLPDAESESAQLAMACSTSSSSSNHTPASSSSSNKLNLSISNYHSNASSNNSLSNCSYNQPSSSSNHHREFGSVDDNSTVNADIPHQPDNEIIVDDDIIPANEIDESHASIDDPTIANGSSSADAQNFNPSRALIALENDHDYEEETWADCEEMSEAEEECTCQDYSDEDHISSDDEELPSKDVDLTGYSHLDTISNDIFADSSDPKSDCTTRLSYRKRRLTESKDEMNSRVSAVDPGTPIKKKRIVDINSPQQQHHPSTPTTSSSTQLNNLQSSSVIGSSGSERRTPRSMLIPTRDNPPPELMNWLMQFQRWSHAERLMATDRLIEYCEPSQVRHMMKVIEPQFQRDFISLLPKELALQVLSYLEPLDLLRAAQTCRTWRFLCDDNLLWKEKCKQNNIVNGPNMDRPKRGRAGKMPPISSPWKAAYMRQIIIEMNWRSRPIREPKVLKGHDDHVITCLQFCGNRIVSGSDDNTLKVWSAITGKCLRTLVGHTGGVWSSQMAGNCIISGSTDRTLKVWNAETGVCSHTLYGHTSTVRCMHLYGDKVVSGSRDATLRVWDIIQGKCLHILVGHMAAVRCVQYDGKLVVSGAYDYMVKVWNPERQECIHTLQGHTNRVYSLQFDGVHVVSGSLDTSIRVWDAESGNCKHTLMGHQSLTSGMELRENILVSGNADSTVKVWDITNGQCLQTLSGPNKHQSAVTCLQFNSRFVITSSDDGTVKLWDVRTGEFIRNMVTLNSGGSGGVVWRIRANDTKLICAVGSRNGTEETKLMVLDFDVEGACLKCS